MGIYPGWYTVLWSLLEVFFVIFNGKMQKKRKKNWDKRAFRVSEYFTIIPNIYNNNNNSSRKKVSNH